MSQAYEDFGFETNNVPLMIEAVPLSLDSIMIVVTKVDDPDEIEERLGASSGRANHRNFKDYMEETAHSTSYEEASQFNDQMLMYCFNNLDEVTSVAHRIQTLYFGSNSIYKYSDKYFLILNDNQSHNSSVSLLISVLSEFGEQGYSSDLNKNFLMEHGDVIIKENAIDILAKYL